MAYTETGFKRSMKVTITKTGNDGSVVTSVYDGQGEFIYNGTTYAAIASDDDFRRLERNGVDWGWDVRLLAFKNYVLTEAGQDAYDSITWSNSVQRILEYDIKLMSVQGSSGTSIIAVAYSGGIISVIPDSVTVQFDTLVPTGSVQIPANQYYSGTYQILDGGGTIFDITNPIVTPSITNNAKYNITIDALNQWPA